MNSSGIYLQDCYVCDQQVSCRGRGDFQTHTQTHKNILPTLMFSDDMKDACKTTCEICGKVLYLPRMRSHTREQHRMDINDYLMKFNKQFNLKFNIIRKVFHRCGICSDVLLLDFDVINKHLRSQHKETSHKKYSAYYMSTFRGLQETDLEKRKPQQGANDDARNATNLDARNDINNVNVETIVPTTDISICFCGGIETETVKCENEGCAIKEFHLSCVGLDSVPAERWFCNDCEVTPIKIVESQNDSFQGNISLDVESIFEAISSPIKEDSSEDIIMSSTESVAIESEHSNGVVQDKVESIFEEVSSPIKNNVSEDSSLLSSKIEFQGRKYSTDSSIKEKAKVESIFAAISSPIKNTTASDYSSKNVFRDPKYQNNIVKEVENYVSPSHHDKARNIANSFQCGECEKYFSSRREKLKHKSDDHYEVYLKELFDKVYTDFQTCKICEDGVTLKSISLKLVHVGSKHINLVDM